MGHFADGTSASSPAPDLDPPVPSSPFFLFPPPSSSPPLTCPSRCGRTVRNNTLTEVLVFHQTLSTPKASYSGRYPSGTPQGRTRKIHIFPKDPIMRTSTILIHFIHQSFLKSILLQYQISECGMINSGI